jgi:hypothetical protein
MQKVVQTCGESGIVGDLWGELRPNVARVGHGSSLPALVVHPPSRRQQAH